jgi:putative FmdB family regulatory protein
MPTYEYRCTACGAEFEKFQRMSEEPAADCTACGKPAERRLSGGAGLLFKGSGFYITDYRSDSYKQAAKSENGGSEKKSDGGTAAPKADKPAKSE